MEVKEIEEFKTLIKVESNVKNVFTELQNTIIYAPRFICLNDDKEEGSLVNEIIN